MRPSNADAAELSSLPHNDLHGTLVEALAIELYVHDWWGYGRANDWSECSEDLKDFWRRKAQVAIRFIGKKMDAAVP
jgi:hypothetical protein